MLALIKGEPLPAEHADAVHFGCPLAEPRRRTRAARDRLRQAGVTRDRVGRRGRLHRREGARSRRLRRRARLRRGLVATRLGIGRDSIREIAPRLPRQAPRSRSSLCAVGGPAVTVAAAATPSPIAGYWGVDSTGTVRNDGDAPDLGDLHGVRLNAPVVGIAATPSGKGYWLAAADGGVFTFGDARFYGSAGNLHLNAPIVGIASAGNGYWLAAADGGVFTFGGARFYGSAGSLQLNAPIVGIAAAPRGYWLAAADGGVFTYGPAHFYGSAGNLQLAAPVVGIAPTRFGRGYRLAASDGGVFTYGDARLLRPTRGMPGFWRSRRDRSAVTSCSRPRVGPRHSVPPPPAPRPRFLLFVLPRPGLHSSASRRRSIRAEARLSRARSQPSTARRSAAPPDHSTHHALARRHRRRRDHTLQRCGEGARPRRRAPASAVPVRRFRIDPDAEHANGRTFAIQPRGVRGQLRRRCVNFVLRHREPAVHDCEGRRHRGVRVVESRSRSPRTGATA